MEKSNVKYFFVVCGKLGKFKNGKEKFETVKRRKHM